MFHFYNFHKFFAFFSNNFFVCPDFLCIKSLSQMYSLFTSSPGQEFGTAHTHTQFSFISSFSEKVFFREWFYISFFFLSFFSSSKCSFAVDTCRWCRIQCNFILHFSHSQRFFVRCFSGFWCRLHSPVDIFAFFFCFFFFPKCGKEKMKTKYDTDDFGHIGTVYSFEDYCWK